MVHVLGRTGLGDIDLFLPLESLLRGGEITLVGEVGSSFFISWGALNLEQERGVLSPEFSFPPGAIGKGFLRLGVEASAGAIGELVPNGPAGNAFATFLLRIVPYVLSSNCIVMIYDIQGGG